ncbi:serine hydrolase [Streptomyces sp. NRRL F-5126]|uniref:serine hydrolase n=1 Tax=Streptomyces sp. NRRL F-5126 TaxID=1463857 RepID=UPI00068CB487|nr:serine hydrolase [Streptomyces sp. NRRL F-5126]
MDAPGRAAGHDGPDDTPGADGSEAADADSATRRSSDEDDVDVPGRAAGQDGPDGPGDEAEADDADASRVSEPGAQPEAEPVTADADDDDDGGADAAATAGEAAGDGTSGRGRDDDADTGDGPAGKRPAAGSGGSAPAGAPGATSVPAPAKAGGDRTSNPRGSAAPAAPGGPRWAKGVDQPTTAMRVAPVAAEPPVDQPTTALKVPAAPPLNGGKDAGPAGSTGMARSAGPGASAGSTFVPLKRDDAAAPAPAAAAAPAPADPERTTQQPVPPKAPLDLLAELTNTPDTPARTVLRRLRIWTPLVVLLAIVYVVVQGVRPLPEPSLALTADSTYRFDGSAPQLPWPSEGEGYLSAPGLGTMDSFGQQKSVPVGSVAKIMTAYLVLQDHPLKVGQKGPSITIDKQAEQEGGLSSEGESTLDTVKAGDKLSLKDALSALMVPSANNIARLLARWDGGSQAAFVKKMNAQAKALGMDNTTYTDPSGLKATTVSTAEDQVKLAEKVVGIPALMAITALPSWTDPSGHTWRNWNTLVPYHGAIGIKTGTTTAAGGNLVFAAKKNVDGKDQLVVGAIFGQHKPPIIDTVNAVSKTAMVAAENVLKRATVVKKGQVVGEVDDGMGGTTPVVATADAKAVGWGGLTEQLRLTAESGGIPHSAKAGTRVGTLTVGNGLSSTKIPVALQKDLVEPGFGAKLSHF